jgi:choline kinase
MKGVILAAGKGSRLGYMTTQCPKPLIYVLERRLVEYTIEAFVSAGIRELVVVVGYRAKMVEEQLGDGSRYGARITYALNPYYKRGNAISVYAARQWVAGEPFVMAMADHMISPAILRTLLVRWDGNNTLCIDRAAALPPQIDDATRVWVDETDFISAIGKELEEWNAIDAGVFLLTPRIFPVIEQTMQSGIEPCTISQAMRQLIRFDQGLRACDVSGAFWADVDTLDDLRYVEHILRQRIPLEVFAVPIAERVAIYGGKQHVG